MTNEIKNVPELRFPGFNGEWELLNLSKVLKDKSDGIKRGPFGGALKKEIFVSDGYAVYEQQNAIYDTQKFRYFITEQKFQEMKGFSIKENDIIMSCSGTIGKLSLIPSVYKKGIINQALIRFRTNNNILADYFLIYMRSNYMQRKILESNPGSAIVNLIPVKELKNLPFPLPNIKEQQKISAFFSKLDQQIELEEQKLVKLEEQKKGYMQKIFSQELRFKDENGNDYPTWKKTTIKEVAKLTVGKSKKNENTGKYIIMDMGTVTKNGTMLTHKSTPHENDLLNKGDLVMPKDDIGGGHIIGKTVFIPESQKYVLGDHVYRLETKKCNGLFLHFYINSDIVNRSLKRKVTGSAQLGLNRKSVEEELVKVPCLEEQEKIGAFFSKLDTFIEKQLSKIELLKERKKGFLQKMFV
ncbi:restriction endonuclease subunit S [Staphylococcus cohnii]|uniref:Restriction endonuclease subunit S n=2 Tax=Staphylococcus cohnii TaxID=29382 RepID=A0ABT6J102_9STAP|nr:restriction endonuclease subunit S [Staphylococcus cohnii]MDH5140350.1 restriction endonuclease subunit S [Staphylococcus cohnii]MDH5158366.1 restriction endonuclease subunit S [Staphylococcus cohnii]MDH5169933.1 restriction endonuclease subunit S [Staphylococcus cohnii]